MEQKRIALLSNVNMDFVIRLLQKQREIYRAEGYGNEIGVMMNPESAYHAFEPEITFLVMDLAEITEHCMEPEAAEERIAAWFGRLAGAVKKERIYYISDAYLWAAETEVCFDSGRKQALEQIWQKFLEAFCRAHANARILPYRHMLERLGEDNAFSRKMWYMGKIPLTGEAQKRLCALIEERADRESKIPKKVLALDLDNTLWGGLAGEADNTPIVLSEEQNGLAYKNLQRVILQMQRQGVLLAIVSKNNEEDAMKILSEHPHMVLRPKHFAAMSINWEPKHENLKKLAEELNLGLDSFVFWDDNPAERRLVEEMLPQVAAPDFPQKPEELPEAMTAIYQRYFAGAYVTPEDLEKTKQYADNAQRNKMAKQAGSYEEYLKQLQLVLRRVDPREHSERLLQLLNKTNQFNLTTNRYTMGQLQEILAEEKQCVYLYRVRDCFGDNGIVAALIADTRGEIPVITDFVMSCRVMGRNIEYALAEEVEKDMLSRGFDRLRGLYTPTAKNRPVEELYRKLGYTQTACGEFEISLPADCKRLYYVKKE